MVEFLKGKLPLNLFLFYNVVTSLEVGIHQIDNHNTMKKLLLLNLVLVFTWYSCVEETQVTRKDQLVIKSQAWFAQNLNSKIWDKKQSLIDWGRASLIMSRPEIG